jgi:hypothetical protein
MQPELLPANTAANPCFVWRFSRWRLLAPRGHAALWLVAATRSGDNLICGRSPLLRFSFSLDIGAPPSLADYCACRPDAAGCFGDACQNEQRRYTKAASSVGATGETAADAA